MTIEISPTPLAGLSEAFRSLGDAWREGDVASAILALAGREPETVDDRRLASLLLRLDGRMRESLRVLNADSAESPAVLQLELAHGLADLRRLPAALRILDRLAEPDRPSEPLARLTESEGELLLGLRGLVLARMERLESARAHLEDITARGPLESPAAVFALACTHLALRDWETALGFFQATAESAPSWPTPRLAEHRCLLILGRRAEAEALIQGLTESFPRDPRVAMVACAHFELGEQPEQVVRVAEAALVGWPSAPESEAAEQTGDGAEAPADEREEPGAASSGAAQWIRLDIPTRLRLSMVRPLQRLGRSAEAKEQVRRIAPGLAEALAETLEGIDPDAPRGRVSIEPIVQERNMCVAACVAVILNARRGEDEEEVDARAIFRDMGGSHGVASWQLDEWVRERGLEPVDIKPETEAIRAAIDAGHPLLITSSSALMGHQELLVGYDDGFAEFELIDPEHGLPHHVPYDDLFERYGTASDTLVALLERGADGSPEVPAGWLDETARVRRLIERAANNGEVEAAQTLIRSLEPGSTAELVTRLRFPDLFESAEAGAAAREAVGRPELGSAVRLQAMLGLLHNRHPEVAAAWQELKGDLIPFERGLYYMHRALARGDWQRLERWTAVLIERAAMVPDLWVLRFKALGGLGRFQESRRALEIALEIEPTHLEANIESLRFSHLDARSRRERLVALTAQHRRSPFLRSVEAALAMDVGKPFEAERLLQEAHRQMPGSTEAALHLRQYYLEQSRPDLAAEVVVPGVDESIEESVGESSEESVEAVDSTDSLDVVEPEAGRPRRAPVARLIARDVRTLIQQVGAKLAEDEEDAPELRRLLRMREAGRLSPEDAIIVTALEIQAVRLREGPSRKRLTELLPKSLPEPPAPFAETIIEGLLERNPAPFEARGLAEWTRARLEGHEWTRSLRYLVAALDELAGLRSEAEQVYNELAEDGHGLAMFRLGRMALEEGRLDEAERHFVAGLKRNPAHIGSHLSLFEIAGRRQQRERAIAAVRRLTELRPYDPDIAALMVGTLQGENRPADRRAIKGWLETHGERYPRAWVDLMEVQRVIDEDPERACAAITEVLREEKPREAAELELRCLEKTLPDDELEVALDAAVERFPESLPLTDMKARRLMKRGRKADAVARHLAVFERTPNPVSVEFVLEHDRDRGLKSLARAVVAIEDTKLRRAAWFTTLEVLQAQQNVPAILGFAEHVAIHRADDLEVRETMLRALAASRQAGPLKTQLAKYMEDGGKDCDTLGWCAAVVAAEDLDLARRAFSRAFNETRRTEFLVQAARCEAAAGREQAQLEMLTDSLAQVGPEPRILSRLMAVDEDRVREHFEAACALIREAPLQPSEEFPLQVAETALALDETVPERWIEWVRAEARRRHVRGRPDGLSEAYADMQDLWATVRPGDALEPFGLAVTSRIRRIHAGDAWSRSTRWIPGSSGERPNRFDPETARPGPRISWELPIEPTPGTVSAQRAELVGKLGLVFLALAAVLTGGLLWANGVFKERPRARRSRSPAEAAKPTRGDPGQRIRGAVYQLQRDDLAPGQRNRAIATLLELLGDPKTRDEARPALFRVITSSNTTAAPREALDALLSYLRKARLGWARLDPLAVELVRCGPMQRAERQDDLIAVFELWFKAAGRSPERQDRVVAELFKTVRRRPGPDEAAADVRLLNAVLGADKSLALGAPRDRLLREAPRRIGQKPGDAVGRFLVARLWREVKERGDRIAIEVTLRMEAASRELELLDDAAGRSQRERLALLKSQARFLRFQIQHNQRAVRGLTPAFLNRLCAAIGLEPVEVLRRSR